MTTRSGVENTVIYDPPRIWERYGLRPDQMVDFKALKGDSTDNIPGVAGIGEKTAASLLLKFGDLRAIVDAAADRASEMSPGPRRRILEAADYLLVAPKVVAVARDIELPPYDATLPSEPRDSDRLEALADQYNLASPVKRLRNALAG
jgi:5'-3' exonuclease